MGDSFGVPGTTDKKTRRGSVVGACKANRLAAPLFQFVQSLGKSGLCFIQLVGNHCEVAPQSTGHLNGSNPVLNQKASNLVVGQQETKARISRIWIIPPARYSVSKSLLNTTQDYFFFIRSICVRCY